MAHKEHSSRLYEITFVRHGETNNNIRRAFQGSFDDHLNDLGNQQALTTAKYIKAQKWQFDLGLTSPLSRCVQTAEILTSQIRLQFELEPLLRERDYGIFENKTPEEIIREFPGSYEKYQQDKTSYRPLKGDTITDVENRIKELFWKRIPKIYPAASKILVVTHVNPFRAILHLLGLVDWDIYGKPFKNAAINRIVTDLQKSKIILFNFSCLDDNACREEINQ